MSLNGKTLTQPFAKASAVIEKTVQTTVQEVAGLPQPMQDYELGDQIGSAGPGLAWKLYSPKSRDGHVLAIYPTVCVWVLDKKALSEARQRAGLSKAAENAFLDVIRGDAARLVRLRHPGVVHVVQALDESKNAMAMVTEPLFASVANAMGSVKDIPCMAKDLEGLHMGLLEVKHGLLEVAETLDFLHNNARLVHRAISPETVVITLNGAWKLCGFGFAVSTDQASDSVAKQVFHYAEYDVNDSVLPLQPSLNYTAPELVRNKTSAVGPASDVFSFGCLAYHLIARKPLFDCHNNVKTYTNRLTYLTDEAFSAIPRELIPDLQRMLSPNEASRPTALDFTAWNGVCIMNSIWKDGQHPSFINFISSFLQANSFRLKFVSIAPDFIFNCGGVSMAFIFVTDWASADTASIFSKTQKLRGQFAHFYVVVTLPTKEQNDSFTCTFFKYSMELGRPPFIPVKDLEMGFEKIVKLAHAHGACKRKNAIAKLKAEREKSVQSMDIYIKVLTSIPGIDKHDATALNQTIGSIEAIAKASKEYILDNTDLSTEKAETISKFFNDPKYYLGPIIK